jgi:hypothetical protein
MVVVVLTADCCLLGLFGPLALAKADTRAAAILVDKANSSSLQRFLHFYTSFIRYIRSKPALEALNGRDR